MKQLNEAELKIIIVVRKKPDADIELSIGAKYRVESEGLAEIRGVTVEPEGEVKDQLLNFAATVVSLIKQKEEIDEH